MLRLFVVLLLACTAVLGGAAVELRGEGPASAWTAESAPPVVSPDALSGDDVPEEALLPVAAAAEGQTSRWALRRAALRATVRARPPTAPPPEA